MKIKNLKNEYESPALPWYSTQNYDIYFRFRLVRVPPAHTKLFPLNCVQWVN